MRWGCSHSKKSLLAGFIECVGTLDQYKLDENIGSDVSGPRYTSFRSHLLRLRRPHGSEDGPHGADQQQKIAEKRHAIQILQILVQLVGQYDLPVIAIDVNMAGEQFFFSQVEDGGEISDPRANRQHPPLGRRIELHIAGNLWAGPYEAHFSFQYIPQLKNFIYFEPAHPPPHTRQPRITDRTHHDP